MDGLVTVEASCIVVSAGRRLLPSNIAICFDVYLGVAGPRASCYAGRYDPGVRRRMEFSSWTLPP